MFVDRKSFRIGSVLQSNEYPAEYPNLRWLEIKKPTGLATDWLVPLNNRILLRSSNPALHT